MAGPTSGNCVQVTPFTFHELKIADVRILDGNNYLANAEYVIAVQP